MYLTKLFFTVKETGFTGYVIWPYGNMFSQSPKYEFRVLVF